MAGLDGLTKHIPESTSDPFSWNSFDLTRGFEAVCRCISCTSWVSESGLV